MSGTCSGITIKKEREREREKEEERSADAFVRGDCDDTSTHVAGGQWDVKYLNNGFIMRSSARRVYGDANGCGILAISYEVARKKRDFFGNIINRSVIPICTRNNIFNVRNFANV